jgi:hypothetical protein
VAVVYLEEANLVKPFPVTTGIRDLHGGKRVTPPDHHPLFDGAFIHERHSSSTTPGVCGMIDLSESLPER